MGESIESLMRRGMVSEKQGAKLGVLKKTKVIPSKMAKFDDKGGKRDQGAGRDRGAAEAGNRHIDKKQDMGSPARASGKPSKGGSVNKSGQPGRNAINEDQTPDFPRGAKVSAKNGKRVVGIRGHAGKSSGPQYGGPNSRKDG